MKRDKSQAKKRLEAHASLLKSIQSIEIRIDALTTGSAADALKARQIERAQKQLAELIEAERKDYEILNNLMQRIEDPRQRLILQMRCFDLAEYEDIAFAIFGDNDGFCDEIDRYLRFVFRRRAAGEKRLGELLNAQEMNEREEGM